MFDILSIYSVNLRVGIGSKPSSIKLLSQNVTLAGFGSTSFQDGLSSMRSINERLSKYLPVGGVDIWKPAFIGAEDIEAVHASTRYATDVRDVTSEQIETMQDDVDPEGYVKAASGDRYVYTSDNVVSFFRRLKETNGER